VFLKFIQPSIEIFNIRIDEPITTGTDLIMAAICFYAFYRIRQQESSGRIKSYFKYYFLTLGIATMAGGLLGHAFLYTISPRWKLVSWIFTLMSVGIISHALIELSKPLIKPVYARVVSRVNMLILSLTLLYTLYTLAFSGVQYYTIFGMFLVVGSLSYVIFQKTECRGFVRLMVGVGVGLLSAFIFSFELGISPWFNHNDISHVILSFSAFSLYKGAVLIIEAPTIV
jgi:MFS family permease